MFLSTEKSSKYDYWIDPLTADRLEGLVDKIEDFPGQMIDPADVEEAALRLDTKAVLNALPEGFSQDDFVGVLKLSLLTECATASYSQLFADGAQRFGAPWLGRFNEKIWTPDEMSHHAPFRHILMNIGFSAKELDQEMRDTQEKVYDHSCARTPIHLTTFGMVQEYLTDHWYGLIAGLLRDSAPETAQMVARVKRRETLHTVWYRDMTTIQLEDNPELTSLVVETLVDFQMPSNSLVPHLQEKVKGWMPYLHVNSSRMVQDMARLVFEVTGDSARMSKLLLEVAQESGYKTGSVPLSLVKKLLTLLGGRGYGLIGEAMLESVGLPRLVHRRVNHVMSLKERLWEAVRRPIRSLIAQQISVRFDGTSA